MPDAELTFDAFWNEEQGWDFGFAQISDDGGATYTSLACTDTTSRSRPGCAPDRGRQRPGLHGLLRDVQAADVQPCRLRRPDGAARVPGVQRPGAPGTDDATAPGFWVDDVKVGGTLVSDGSSLDGWKSFTETKPNTVAGFTVWILSIDSYEAQDQCEAAAVDGRLLDQR